MTTWSGRFGRARGVGVAVVTLLTLASVGGRASAQQEVQESLTPLQEYVREETELSEAHLLYVVRRCAALFRVAAEWKDRQGDSGTAEMYGGWRIGFATRALELTETLAQGLGLRDVPRANQWAIRQLEGQLRERADRAVFFPNDPLLSSDLRTCRDFVDELVL